MGDVGALVLRISGLTKRYGDVQALDDVHLTIGAGMFGLLGPNGSGKSSLMRTIATLQAPDSGSIFLGDLDVLKHKEELRKRLGYLPQEFGVYPGISAMDLLQYLAMLKGVHNKKERQEVASYLLHKVNLYEERNKAVSAYSGGMRQRFGVAQCMIGNPDLIIVDEPTAGLDPSERNRFYSILNEIGTQAIVLLSTHIVQDVQEMCSRFAIIDRGTVLFSGKTEDALHKVVNQVYCMEREEDDIPNVLTTKYAFGKKIHRVYGTTQPEHASTVEATIEDMYFATLRRYI